MAELWRRILSPLAVLYVGFYLLDTGLHWDAYVHPERDAAWTIIYHFVVQPGMALSVIAAVLPQPASRHGPYAAESLRRERIVGLRMALGMACLFATAWVGVRLVGGAMSWPIALVSAPLLASSYLLLFRPFARVFVFDTSSAAPRSGTVARIRRRMTDRSARALVYVVGASALTQFGVLALGADALVRGGQLDWTRFGSALGLLVICLDEMFTVFLPQFFVLRSTAAAD